MSYVVALTGGIGSGKSTVAAAFEKLNIPVIDADIIARQVVEPNTPALDAIVTRYGQQILTKQEHLDRRVLRDIIFNDPAEKAWLNALLHPLIQQETQRQIAQATAPYAIWAVPLLVENHLEKYADRILVVDVSRQTQIERTMNRDRNTLQQINNILDAQASRSERLEKADDIIDNNGNTDLLTSQVYVLHKKYLKLAEEPTRRTLS